MSSKAEQRRTDRDRRNRERLQLLLWILEDWMLQEDTQGMTITEVRTRVGTGSGGLFLTIVKATFEGRPYVGFHSADTPEDAIRGALERIRNTDMKWREDKPYEERKR